MYTKQQTFNKVARHLLTMKKRSLSASGGSCRYRGDQGSKCAVGVLIPDEQYSEDMEYHTARHLDVVALLELLGHDPELCLDLQRVHDNIAFFYEPNRYFSLECVAQKHGLRMVEP